MLKLPKGLKKKKKGKKSKRKDEELFTEAELEQYRQQQQQQQRAAANADADAAAAADNEEWSKFKNLTTGIDSVLKKTQGDLDRIKSTSFFQRIPAGPREVDSVGHRVKQAEREEVTKPVVEVTAADFPQLAAASSAGGGALTDEERSEAITDDESEEDDQDDIFDTSYVEAVERGEVKLAYVPDSPEDFQDDDIFDTSHVDAIIKGQENKASKGKKAINIGVAVEVLTGRIDNVTLPVTKRPKRVIPGDLLLENVEKEYLPVISKPVPETQETSILDVDEDIPISTPIDLSVSLHTSLIKETAKDEGEINVNEIPLAEEEFDEFSQLAAESLEVGTDIQKLEEKEIYAEPVIEESWSAFEADRNGAVFAESIIKDQIDVIEPYIDQDDPFDTSFADAAIPSSQVKKEAVLLEEDDDFDPRAEEIQRSLNNRRKSSVRIHLTDPSGLRESITSDDINTKDETHVSRDLLGGSTTDLSEIGDCILDPIELNDSDFDPFDTSIVDKVVVPGKVELKFIEKELIGDTNDTTLYRIPSDPDFDPRAEEPELPKTERRASRPENLIVSKSVVFKVDGAPDGQLDAKIKPAKPVTPYYTRNLSITEDINENSEEVDFVGQTLTRTRSDEDLALKPSYQTKRRHSEFPQTLSKLNKSPLNTSEILEIGHSNIQAKVLTPIAPPPPILEQEEDIDPFDTSFAVNIAPGKAELKLLAKEFSCEEIQEKSGERDLLDPSEDDIFQIKALTPEPSGISRIPEEDIDPFDTSFANDLQPGRGELKLLESEFLN